MGSQINSASSEIQLRCQQCMEPIHANEMFCGSCGKEVKAISPNGHEDVFTVIGPTLFYYFITLVILGVYKFTDVFPEEFSGSVTIEIILSVTVLGFAGYFFKDIKPLCSLRRIKPLIILVMIAGAIVSAIIVSVLAHYINISLFDELSYEYRYEDTTNPLLWSILLICVQPAMFEEIAFRGFMFTNLQSLSSPIGAVYVSAILFGIMHLSFLALIWLIPLGIVFAMLRMKYNSLWYGIVGHFCYNFTIVLIDTYY